MKYIIFIVVVVVLFFFFFSSLEEKPQNHTPTPIEEAYNEGVASIDAEAKAIRVWVLSGKKGTPEAACALTGIRTKWKYVWTSEKDFAEYAAQIIGSKTHTPQQYEQRLHEGIDGCYEDICNIEAKLVERLAKDGNISDMGKEELQQKLPTSPPSAPADVRDAIVTDVVTFLASEGCGALIAIAMGPETGGLSIAIGFVIDQFFSWLVDTEGNLERKLNTAIDELANSYENAFRTEMMKKLNERKALWVKMQ